MWVKQKYTSGFTIVELLIVIFVIGILAAISVVSYNGIQARAKTSVGLTNLELVSKKAQIVNVILGRYPTSLADFELNSETTLASTGVVFSSVSLDGTQPPNTIVYAVCSPSVPTGFKVRYYDYGAGTMVVNNIGILVGPCTIISS